MAYIDWDDKFSVDVEGMDNQHKKLFRIANRLHEIIETKDYGDKLSEAFDALINYVKEHFHDEEQLMAEWGFPELESQRKAHKAFAKQLSASFSEFKSGQTKALQDLLDYLEVWLINHILLSDKKYGEFIATKGSVDRIASPK